MYENYFGLKQEPFRSSPDPQFLYPGLQHQEALARLSYGLVTRKGVMSLVGEPGTGKTTLATTLLKGLTRNTMSSWIFTGALNHLDFLKKICLDFGLKVLSNDYGRVLMTLYRFLVYNSEAGRNAVVIIDEAQGMSVAGLEEVYQLSNLETIKYKLVQIILVGQPGLEKVLENSKLRQLRQRLSIRTRLIRLNRKETIEYIYHRLKVAGAGETIIFDPGILKHIYALSDGIPRLINSVCDSALLFAFRHKKKIVDFDIIKNMVTNKMVNSLVHPPIISRDEYITGTRKKIAVSTTVAKASSSSYKLEFDHLDLRLLNLG